MKYYFEDDIIEPALMTVHVYNVKMWKLKDQLCICVIEETKRNHENFIIIKFYI